MIYQTGTIATTAGQTKIKGTGTRWKDNLSGISEGCPISYHINNTVFMNTVLSVNSDTEINLTYPVPATADKVNYQIATFVLDSMSDGVRKMLANQQYIGYFLRNMDAWLTQDGIVEVKTPTGETVRLESLIELKKQMDNKLDKTGGTITKNGEALTLKNTSANQSLFLKFRKSDGTERGYLGAPNDTDRISLVNSTAGTSLTLSEDKRLLWQGKDVPTLVNPQAQDTAVQYATPMWIIRSNGVNGEWVKIAKIGGAGSSYGGSRYLFTLNCTTSGFSSQSNFPAFAHLSITIGNGSNPNRNVEASFIGLEAYGINNRSPVRIRQLSAFEAEVWVGIGSYSRLSCSCITYDSMVPYSNVFLNDILLLDNGDKSVYEGTNNYLYATANKYGNVESRDTVKVTATGNYPRVTLTRYDGTYVNLEADLPSNGNMANLIHRNQRDANIAVVGIPNKSGTLYNTGNTIKDANGNLKAASPIIKVFADHIELNDESEGIELEKLGTGRYKLKGTLGMNSDASWGGIHGGLVVPNGINNLPLVWADFDVLPDGDIIIETRYRKHTLHPRLEAQRLMTYPEFLDENNVEREDYDYCDIPNGHWIDVRVNMPSDSIYNQKLSEAERLAKLEAERLAEEEAKRAAEEAERAEQEATERKQYDLGDNDTLL